MFRFFNVLLIVILIIGACKSSGKLSGQPANENSMHELNQIICLAWNEDSTLPRQFNFYRDSGFLYTIHHRDSSTGEIRPYSYQGKVRETSDTLYLIYNGQKPPEPLAGFLVKEISGNYLIQYLSSDRSGRMFFGI